MKYKIKIIITYFGKFNKSIIPFLHSCENNQNFEWLIFTDDLLTNIPENVKIINCNLADIKKKIEKILGFTICLSKAYKLCDFRPAFGLVFQEYLKGYDFWGWGDVDLVYGDLSKFITTDILDNYDKIYPCGHLSLLRNCDEVNKAFMLDIQGTLNYKTVFTNHLSCIFDEYKGLNEKLSAIGKHVYGKIDFADMDIIYSRFRTVDKKTLRTVFPGFLYMNFVPKNYKKQSFIITKDGKAYRIYIKSNGDFDMTELVYIHYRHKIPFDEKLNFENDYFITNKGFINSNIDGISSQFIDSINHYCGKLKEFLEFLVFYKNIKIMQLGKNKRLRNIVRKIKRKEPLK